MAFPIEHMYIKNDFSENAVTSSQSLAKINILEISLGINFFYLREQFLGSFCENLFKMGPR